MREREVLIIWPSLKSFPSLDDYDDGREREVAGLWAQTMDRGHMGDPTG